MSISAPEAHSAHLPDKVTAGADDFTSVPLHHLPEPDSANAEQRQGREYGSSIRRVLARTALLNSMAGDLAKRSREPGAQTDSRRLAILLARGALRRHHSKARRSKTIAMRYM